jgi:hypothetical protein
MLGTWIQSPTGMVWSCYSLSEGARNWIVLGAGVGSFHGTW